MRLFKRKNRLTVVLAIVAIVTGVLAYNAGQSRRDIDYPNQLELVVAKVNDSEITLREFAFYVAYEENIVEEQAVIYNPSDTNKYWNLHIDGEFVRVAARRSAVDMAIHDELFYRMAIQEEITLNEKESIRLANSQEDFWSDLCDYDKQLRLGIDREDIDVAMEKIALAQKYQEIYAALNNKSVEEYNFEAETYKSLLEEQRCSVEEELLNKLKFGNITLEH